MFVHRRATADRTECSAGVGFVVGDILAQKITGGGLDAFRSFQLGAVGAGLDVFRQEFSGKAEEMKDGKLAQAAKAVTSQATWGPIVACGMYAAIKVAEGNPGEIVQGVEVRAELFAVFAALTHFPVASRIGNLPRRELLVLCWATKNGCRSYLITGLASKQSLGCSAHTELCAQVHHELCALHA